MVCLTVAAPFTIGLLFAGTLAPNQWSMPKNEKWQIWVIHIRAQRFRWVAIYEDPTGRYKFAFYLRVATVSNQADFQPGWVATSRFGAR
jgi:hypothetical protein